MTADEYREQLVRELRATRDTRHAERMIADANQAIRNISKAEQIDFWEHLENDLDRAAQDAARIIERQAVGSLSAVIAAAQSAIAQHQARLSSGK